MALPRTRFAPALHQRGIAALELSLTLTMLLIFICAVVGYGVLF